jgi:hypothetical protein
MRRLITTGRPFLPEISDFEDFKAKRSAKSVTIGVTKKEIY